MTIPGFWAPCYAQKGAEMVSSLALMQMWEPDEMPCVPKTSWGSLDQDDTRCLFQGILDHEDQDVVPLEPSEAVTL